MIDRFEAEFTPARRKVIYRVAGAACLILSVNGFITADEASMYVQAVAYVLGIGVTELAAAHVTGADE